MLYHALVLSNTAVAIVRSADDGITDKEFAAGVRKSFYGESRSRLDLIDKLMDDGIEVLDNDAWNNQFEDHDEITERYKSSRSKRDKWDAEISIY